ncbi:MAG: Uroporphyrinogen-III C-methyltransferase [Candidatus Bathyarchaeota archaeon B63]|nr:MAG: Uroporphyrinogen-III C-methyltransferase [Candidatus Bathyarchaeota archaeon B63]
MGTGKVYLVGAGPGDPELLTVKAVKILEKADVVVYDRLVAEDVLRLVPEGAVKIYAGKLPGGGRKAQDEINETLIREARKGKIVVRLKGGDPFLFGRGGEEAQALRKAGSRTGGNLGLGSPSLRGHTPHPPQIRILTRDSHRA